MEKRFFCLLLLAAFALSNILMSQASATEKSSVSSLVSSMDDRHSQLEDVHTKQDAYTVNEENCAKANEKIIEAKKIYKECRRTSTSKYESHIRDCPAVKKVVVYIEDTGNPQKIEEAYRKLGLDIGVLTEFTTKGKIELKPYETCVYTHELNLKTDLQGCSNNLKEVKRAFANCSQ